MPPLATLDDLDAEDRAIRHEQIEEWRRTRNAEVTRAKRTIEDPNATPDAKREAKILIGAYAIDPFVMLASGSGTWDHGNQGMAAPANSHPKTPLPPTRRTLLQRLRRRSH